VVSQEPGANKEQCFLVSLALLHPLVVVVVEVEVVEVVVVVVGEVVVVA